MLKLNHCQKITTLKTQITQLQKEKAQLRLFLHEIIEAYYRTVNQAKKPRKGEEAND